MSHQEGAGGPHVFDVSDLTVSAVDAELANMAEATLAAKRKSKGKEKADAPMMGKTKKLTKAQIDFAKKGFALPGEKPKSAPSAARPSQDAKDIAGKLQKIGIIKGYHERWPQDYPAFKPINPLKVSHEELDARIGECKAVRNRSFAPHAAVKMLELVGFTFEQVYQNYIFNEPWNPIRGQSLLNLGKVMRENQALFQEELDEMVILYPGFFQQPLWMRFGVKFYMVIQEVQKRNANLPNATGPSDPRHADMFSDI
jgi:hypothetical protein